MNELKEDFLALFLSRMEYRWDDDEEMKL